MKTKLAFALVVLASACGYETSQLRLRTAVDSQQPNLDRCYAEELEREPSTEGTIKVLLHVPTNGPGTIDSVEVSRETPIASGELQDCLRRVLIGLPIGQAPIQNDLLVEYIVRFESERS